MNNHAIEKEKEGRIFSILAFIIGWTFALPGVIRAIGQEIADIFDTK